MIGRPGVFFAKLLPVVAFLALASAAAAQDVRTSISGTVYDSVGRRFLDSALVQLVRVDRPGTAETVTAAGGGKFRFDSVGAGTWLLGFIHPVLDSLGLPLPTLQVTVREPTVIRALLAIPSPASIIAGFCGTTADSAGLWYGHTKSAVTGRVVPGATVVSQWSRIVVVDRRVERQVPVLTLESGDDGAFHHCFMPRDEIVLGRAWHEADSSGVVTFTMPPSGLIRRDIYVGPVHMVEARIASDSAGLDTVVVPVRAGSGSVRGQVTRKGGVPVKGARLRFPETGAEAVTNDNGYFLLDSLPLGSFTVDARALGFLPVLRPVDLVAGEVATADFLLESRQAFLDTVKIVSRRLVDTQQHQEFLRRKQMGFGTFIDEEDIEKRNPMFVSDLMRMTPGVTVLPGSFGSEIRMRSTSSMRAYCSPALFIDGMRVGDMEGVGGLDTFVNPQEVRAIEVYSRGVQVPAQFLTMNGCGSIVVWTGARTSRLRP